MSMDFPDYEVIRAKSKRLALIWMLGDKLYYIGLMGAIFVVTWAPVNTFFSWLKGSQIGMPLLNVNGLAALATCLFLFSIGQPLKRYARVSAGIQD